MSNHPMRIGEFGARINRAPITIRRWEAQGKIEVKRTSTGQRYYTEDDVRFALSLESIKPPITIVYLRVSSRAQIDDLKSQRAAMERYALENSIDVDSWVEESVS